MMRRRRSRNRSDSTPGTGLLSKLPRLVLILLLLAAVANWGAGLVLDRLAAGDGGRAVVWSDKELGRLFDTDQPGTQREVLAESRSLADTVYAPLTEYRMAAFQGRHVTVDVQGRRGGVIGATGPQVALFGGGAAFGVGLSDRQTVAQAIADGLGRDGLAARVANWGAVGWYSTQERVAFAQMLAGGDKPDVAVFLDGVDDFLHCGQPEMTAWSERLATTMVAPPMEGLLRDLALVRLVGRLSGQTPVPAVPDAAKPICAGDAVVDRAVARLDANRRLIAAMAERFGVKVLFVQAPVSTYHYDNAKRAVALKPEQMEPFIATAKGYARLAEMRGSARLWEQNLLWLAELEPQSGNAYAGPLDYAPAMATAVGAAIAPRVADLLRPASSVPAAGPGPAAPVP